MLLAVVLEQLGTPGWGSKIWKALQVSLSKSAPDVSTTTP